MYGYGMSDGIVSLSLAFAKEPLEVKSGSFGTVVRNAEMKIVDLDKGASLPRNKAGEICIRGNHIIRDDNENRTCGYPSEPNPNLTGKTRCDWVRVLPGFKFRVRVWYC
ncbi:hypothetical protein Lal_00040574 [Lupinus albus]|uniref:4-coumarate--CoA ligase n=1 Tax=Lupinus albus TaxID=3870 RepID=A0A6A5NUR5_LUPAL|nr:putative 4-coumarate--CoA ligase [Lupinus albus]KAF1887520.1 hypothetical protein Lal_00040574 [Lupinus albus]